MDISIDLGNVWDMLSAVGTVGAVILSLWILRIENKKKINILIDSKIQTYEKDGIISSNLDYIIQVRAYNFGKSTVGMLFIGFGVGVTKKNFFKRLFSNEDYKISTYVSTIDKILDSPTLEMIQPGQTSKKHQIQSKYIYDTSKKYIDSKGDLFVLSVFKDLDGKSHYGKIKIKNPTEKD